MMTQADKEFIRLLKRLLATTSPGEFVDVLRAMGEEARALRAARPVPVALDEETANGLERLEAALVPQRRIVEAVPSKPAGSKESGMPAVTTGDDEQDDLGGMIEF